MSNTNLDVKSIITGIATAALVSVGSMVWFLGGIENRVVSLERQSTDTDTLLEKVNVIGQQVAVMGNDINYVKENMKDLNVNSNVLANDVRDLRVTVKTMQQMQAVDQVANSKGRTQDGGQ